MPDQRSASGKHYGRRYFENVLRRLSAKSQRTKLRLREVWRHKPGGTLLEIGCGQGAFLELAAERFCVSGIDISAHAIRQARQTLGDCVRRCDVEERHLPADAYDVVVAFNVLEHLRCPREVIKAIYASLRPDGVLVGSVPNKQYVVGRIATLLSNLDPTHHNTLAPIEWYRFFHESGFRQIQFLGEVTLGPKLARYLRGRLWPYLAFNLIFICQK